MGYTHYWDRDPQKEAPDSFGRFALDAQKIVKAAQLKGIGIADGFGEGEPTFEEGVISFNGVGPLSHETFTWSAIPKNPEWRSEELTVFDFCKTSMKPYDAVVTACLIRAKVVYGDALTVSSDGGWDPEPEGWGDWQEGRNLYEEVFGVEAVKP
jgi:hypothetical protein